MGLKPRPVRRPAAPSTRWRRHAKGIAGPLGPDDAPMSVLQGSSSGRGHRALAAWDRRTAQRATTGMSSARARATMTPLTSPWTRP